MGPSGTSTWTGVAFAQTAAFTAGLTNMRTTSRMAASAALGALVLAAAPVLRAQAVTSPPLVKQIALVGSGSIVGTVQDEHGAPVSGALVSALGVSRAFAVADKNGQFELHGLSAGAYLVRAHLAGFTASPGAMVDVRA